jgi:hypothetical protein
MDIVDDLRDLNSMHTPKEVSDIGEKAADEIERLRGQVEFERASLRSAFQEMREYDKQIEWLRKQNAVLETELALVRTMLPNVKAYQTGTGDFTPLKDKK